jgi:hypothetical protein
MYKKILRIWSHCSVAVRPDDGNSQELEGERAEAEADGDAVHEEDDDPGVVLMNQ